MSVRFRVLPQIHSLIYIANLRLFLVAEPSGLASPDVPFSLAKVLAPSIGHMGTSCGGEDMKAVHYYNIYMY